jgi:hypothetical protein
LISVERVSVRFAIRETSSTSAPLIFELSCSTLIRRYSPRPQIIRNECHYSAQSNLRLAPSLLNAGPASALRRERILNVKWPKISDVP